MKKVLVPIVCILLLSILAVYLITTAYQKRNGSVSGESVETEELVSLDDLIATDTVLLAGKDLTAKKLTIRPLGDRAEYELIYDGTVPFTNKYGNAITVEEIPAGEILEITYSKHSGVIRSVQVSDENWTLEDVTDFEVNEKKKMITLMGDAYQFDDNIAIFASDAPAALMDLNEMDTITVKGFQRKVCSLIVKRGHGYLRIRNDTYFVGGWIEVGQKIIRRITEDMLLPVPEGSYTVKVSNRGYAGTEKVTVKRDEETVLDLAGIKVEEVAICHVQFKLTPSYAQLYVDDEITDYEERVPLEFGTHRIRVEAAGYQTVNSSVKVGNQYANIEIALDPVDEDATEDAKDKTPGGAENQTEGVPTGLTSGNDVASATTTPTPSDADHAAVGGSRKIYVEAPVGAEVYLDGNYIGVAPVNVNKVTGSHTITLSKSGSVTKSYTIYVESDDRDVTLSFSDLLPEGGN